MWFRSPKLYVLVTHACLNIHIIVYIPYKLYRVIFENCDIL